MANLTFNAPTTTPPLANEVKLRDALLASAQNHADALAALAHQQVRANEMEEKLLAAEHARFSHGAIPSQRAIIILNGYRDDFERVIRKALLDVAKGLDPDDVFQAAQVELTPPIFHAIGACREIEMANGAAGWCSHMRMKDAPTWSASSTGEVVRTLRLVRP